MSIVIVSWNVAGLLADCLRSIERHKGNLTCEIIVVDNRSADDSVAMLRRDFPEAQVVANLENVGFARANNQGFARATGRHIFILNPDTLLADDSLSRMAAYLDRHPGVGMVGPKLCYPDGALQAVCARRLPTLLDIFLSEILRLDEWRVTRGVVRPRLWPYAYDRSQSVEAISGAAMLVRREVVAAIGGFGESFVHAGEDLDFCYRVHGAGADIWYLHDCTVIHLGGQSSKQAPVWTAMNSLLSCGEYFRRCRGPLHALALRIMVIALWIPSRLAMGALHLLTGKDSWSGFRERWNMARALIAWRRIH